MSEKYNPVAFDPRTFAEEAGKRDPAFREAYEGMADEFAALAELLRAELETERMRLAACGVVALANTPDSAKQAREMRPKYWSASCSDVARMVDENIKLRAKVEAMEKQEPVGKIVAFGESLHEPSWRGGRLPPLMTELYALPGAKGEEK